MRRAGTVALLAALLGACVPGHRLLPPAATVAPPLSWRDVPGGAGTIDPRWWRAFGDPALDRLVEAALARNTDVLAATARVAQSRAQVRLARSALLPRVDASGSAAQMRALGVDTQTITAEINASWDIDLFGRLTALTEAARRSYVASEADRDATALSVAAQTVQTYVGLVAVDAQVQLTRETLRSRLETLRVAQDQANLGYTSRLEYLQARGEYETVAAQLPSQQLAQRQQENALAILVGDLPQAVARAQRLSTLRVPAVPASLPSALLRRRPDLARAEYLLAAADSTIAAERAAFLPDLSLSGSYGQVLSSVANFNPATIWSIGGSVLAPLFRGGELRANLDIAVARRDQAAFTYRAAVLAAFGDVENGLTAIFRLREQVVALDRRVTTARQSLAVATDRYNDGYSDFLDLLDAQRSLYSAEQAQISARSDQLSNIAALTAALGGGWEPGGR